MKKYLIVGGLILILAIIILLSFEHTIYIEGKDIEVKQPEVQDPVKEMDSGIASYYDYTLKSGWSSVGHLVCASRDYPRKSYLRVYYKDRFVVCKVTDYGPDKKIHPDRIIDLSSSAFSVLASTKLGVIPVRVERIQ